MSSNSAILASVARKLNRGGYDRSRRPMKRLNIREKKQVKRIVRFQQEKKNFPFYIINGSASTAGTITKLTIIPQGDSGTTRDGNNVNITRIQFRYSFAYGDATNVCRIIIFQWKNDDTNDFPTVAKLIQDPVNNSWLGSQIFANPDARILYDRLHFVSGNGFAVTGSRAVIKSKKYAKKLKYNAGVNTGSNQLYVLYLSDSSTSTHPTFNMWGVVSYTDS